MLLSDHYLGMDGDRRKRSLDLDDKRGLCLDVFQKPSLDLVFFAVSVSLSVSTSKNLFFSKMCEKSGLAALARVTVIFVASCNALFPI